MNFCWQTNFLQGRVLKRRFEIRLNVTLRRGFFCCESYENASTNETVFLAVRCSVPKVKYFTFPLIHAVEYSALVFITK